MIASMKQENGFTLIEVIASLVIVGILSVFAGLFLVVGIQGYDFTRKATEAAMNAEVALNRISLELKSIETIPAGSPPDEDVSLSYTSSEDTLKGDRVLKFDSAGNLSIKIDGGAGYKLIENVTNPILKVQTGDIDDDGTDDYIAYITVGFTLGKLPAFQTRVYPRNMVSKSW